MIDEQRALREEKEVVVLRLPFFRKKQIKGLLPGGRCPWHRYNESKKGHYSQLLLERAHKDRNPLLPLTEDKYRSRELVASKGVCHLTELYHWSEDVTIDWDNLPERCVIKPNHWTGDALFIMDNGPVPLVNIPRKFRFMTNRFNRYRVIRNWRDQNGKYWPKWRIERLLRWTMRHEFPVPLEWGAATIAPRGIMIEELLTDNNHLPDDWKVHVFHGKAGFIQYDIGRFTTHSQSIYTLDGQRIHQSNPNFSQEHTPDEIVSLLGKDGIDELVHIAERLAEDIDYTRVDLYYADGKWYFGEFTNYQSSCHPQSNEWEELGGRLWLNESP